MTVRLDHFLKLRGDAFRWPEELQPDLRCLADKLTQFVTSDCLLENGIHQQEEAESAAIRALKCPQDVAVTFGHSAIQLIEQLLMVLSTSEVVCTLQNDFFLFDETIRKLKLDQRRFTSIADLAKRAPPRATVLLSAPNNPTGQDLTEEELLLLLNQHVGPVLIDETYHLFASHPHLRPVYLSEHKNLTLVRSFSKSGLPGTGVGYFLAHRQVAEQFKDARVRSMLGTAQAAIALGLFENHQDLETIVVKLVDAKHRAAERISRETRHRPLPGSCDFLLVETEGKDGAQLAQDLTSAGLPAVSYRQIPGFERVIKLFPATYFKSENLINALSS